jgi:hypothetical protein
MTTHGIDLATLAAYRTTRYIAWCDDETLELRVGVQNPYLQAMMRRHGVHGGCFVTGWNPKGCLCDDATNSAANAVLEDELRQRGWYVAPGEGRGMDGAWPPEKSYLVLGAGFHESAALCERYEQNAVLVFGEDATPELLLGKKGG